MGLTGVTHLLTCSLGASWRGLAQGPLRVPYMEHGCRLLAYFSSQAPSRRARSPASVWERPQRARLSEGILAAREALDGSY